jgi:hypothetical protein
MRSTSSSRSNLRPADKGEHAERSGACLTIRIELYIVDNESAPIMSSSYGVCELQLGSENASVNKIYQQGATEGISIVVSAGDQGPAGCSARSADTPDNVGLQVNGFASGSSRQERASGCLRNRRRHIWEVESPSAKVADPDEFRCSGIPFRQGMSLRLEPHFKFIIGAEGSDDLRLRLGICVAKRRGSIHSLR